MKYVFSKAVNLTLGALLLSLFAYGLLSFPNVPIRPCEIQFCSKYGEITTREMNESFVLWERALIGLFIVAFTHRLIVWLMGRRGDH